MSDQTLTIPKANPNMDAQGQFQFLNRPMPSRYFESEFSIFGSPYNAPMGTAPSMTGMGMPMMGGMGMMPGMGMGMPMMGWYADEEYINKYVDNMKILNNGMYDIYTNNDNRQTQFAFDQRGNRSVLAATGIDLNESLVRLKTYIQDNNMRAACDLYKQLCDTYEAAVGEEYDDNGNRISNKLKSFKNQLAANYQQVNGSNLVADIEAHGSGEFSTMFESWFGSKQPSAKEAISYMTGDAQQYGFWARIWRSMTRDGAKAELEESTSY